MIQYVALKDTRVAYQVSKKWFVYTIKEVHFKDGKVVCIDKFKTTFGVKTMLKELIAFDLDYGINEDEIVVYNYTRRNLEIEGIEYYPLTDKFIRHFE